MALIEIGFADAGMIIVVVVFAVDVDVVVVVTADQKREDKSRL